ncbi:MAG: ATP synthase gamma chain [Candidatus Uhrbacteria bacterium GW2011_GWE2_45_35]|uniref:ATP synthase gamma chain n=2 Tax=Candidatus Uhriibacteriota TaxID=1752732 RepID=A0A0G1JFB7_9BACT|nr:MAG: ATP synthase gamma chain [Candidatus Uhrbacteria bacterium GW2011_GWF2_44_350]KKU06770.1 MAG: ATP synthase gamma chain [Candidatus Uhrbacteria bacterium GW2011_GWE2_45_35]
MALSTRAIRRRIKSVKNTSKITKAMELVSASKMRKAVSSVLMSRPFARLAWDTVSAIGRVVDVSLHPLLKKDHQSGKTLLILLTSDRGLAAGFNTNMVKKAMLAIKETSPEKIEVIAVGRKGADAARRAGLKLVASFTGITNNPKFEEILPIGKMAVDEFVKENYDRVILAYTDFISAVNQQPVVLELLPFGSQSDYSAIGEVSTSAPSAPYAPKTDYTFEPSPEEVLNRLLPRLVETMVYQAVLESAASEHSARMLAMRNASDAAGDMIDSLTFTYNQFRQAAITREIAEISGGKAALE